MISGHLGKLLLATEGELVSGRHAVLEQELRVRARHVGSLAGPTGPQAGRWVIQPGRWGERRGVLLEPLATLSLPPGHLRGDLAFICRLAAGGTAQIDGEAGRAPRSRVRSRSSNVAARRSTHPPADTCRCVRSARARVSRLRSLSSRSVRFTRSHVHSLTRSFARCTRVCFFACPLVHIPAAFTFLLSLVIT